MPPYLPIDAPASSALAAALGLLVSLIALRVAAVALAGDPIAPALGREPLRWPLVGVLTALSALVLEPAVAGGHLLFVAAVAIALVALYAALISDSLVQYVYTLPTLLAGVAVLGLRLLDGLLLPNDPLMTHPPAISLIGDLPGLFPVMTASLTAPLLGLGLMAFLGGLLWVLPGLLINHLRGPETELVGGETEEAQSPARDSLLWLVMGGLLLAAGGGLIGLAVLMLFGAAIALLARLPRPAPLAEPETRELTAAGFGDVYLWLLIGVLLGALEAFMAFGLTVVLAVPFAVAALILARLRGAASHMAYGPYIIAGALLILSLTVGR